MEKIFFCTAHGAALVVLLLSSIWDIRFRRIPNLCTIPAVFAGIVLTGFRQLAELAIVLPCCILLFVLGFLPVLGKGDLKLIMALTALCGPYTALATTGIAAVSVVVLQLIRHPGQVFCSICDVLCDLVHFQFSEIGADGKSVPFAPYLLCGFLICQILHFIMMGGIP